VVLSADPTKVAPEEIKEIQVEKTIIGGEVVWEL
jgi:predicted amidohydrolase YtcJ